MPEEVPNLTPLEYRSPNREFLEARGWTYRGSVKIESDPAFTLERYTHYFAKGNKLLPLGEATAFEVLPQPRNRSDRPRGSRIDPDVQAMPLSRSRKYQIMWNREGRCMSCGNVLDKESRVFCTYHLERRRMKAKK